MDTLVNEKFFTDEDLTRIEEWSTRCAFIAFVDQGRSYVESELDVADLRGVFEELKRWRSGQQCLAGRCIDGK